MEGGDGAFSGSLPEAAKAPGASHGDVSPTKEETVSFTERPKLRRNQTAVEVSAGSTQAKPQRLLARDRIDRQSSGNFNIRRVGKSFAVLMYHDVYHAVLSISIYRLLPAFGAVYLFFYALFAAFWLWVASPCNVGVDTYREAFYLSVETMTTIGYGVPDPFFNDCIEAMPVILSQSFVGLFLDVIVLNIVFQRVSSASARSVSVIFSESAVLKTSSEGRVRLAFRVCDMRHRPLLEAWVRLYCILHVSNPENPDLAEVRVAAMKISEPSTDVAEGKLFLCLPMMIEHEVDEDSPLAPPNCQAPPTMEEVEAYVEKLGFVEIIACLVGMDELTGASTEARHSYTKEELHVGRTFAPCMRLDSSGMHMIDFPGLHATIPE
mmetsp:Transcript_32808/g.60009  ORF Transcript_32808/g.60009 Transcript_32808/m.60009 type:complete len:379 (+) Transcript_32808:86-1222(+)